MPTAQSCLAESHASRDTLAVHCIEGTSGTLQIVAAQRSGLILLDAQDRHTDVDGRTRCGHAFVPLDLAAARELVRDLINTIAEVEAAPILRPVPAPAWSA